MLTGRRFGGTSAMSSPSIRIRPALARSKPASMRKSVVLPQPDGPSSAKNSFGRISSDTSSTATTLPKRLVTPSMLHDRGRAHAALSAVWVGRCSRIAITVSTMVRAIRMVEAALTSGVAPNRTME